MRAAVYVRISQDREDTRLGVARQEADCRQLAQLRDWTVVEVFEDNDVSAFSRKPRPAYMRMLHAIRAGEFDAVLCWAADRLHRSVVELEEYIDACRSRDVITAAVRGGDLALNSAGGRRNARLLGAVGQGASEEQSERLTRKMVELAQAGKPTGGPRAYGYTRGRQGVVPEEAAVVREMAGRVIGGWAVLEVVRDLERRGVRTANGGPWRDTGVVAVLRTPEVAGWKTYNGKITARAVWEPLLDQQTWERTVAALDARRRTAAGPPVRYALSGIAQCGEPDCRGRVMHVNTGRKKKGEPDEKGVPRLICRRTPPAAGCGQSIDYAAAEAHVAGRVCGWLDNPDTLRGIMSAGQTDLSELVAAIEADRARLDQLGADLADDPAMTSQAFSAATARIEARIAGNRARLAAVRPAELPPDLIPGQALETWKASGVGVRKTLIRAAAERIVIHRSDVRGRRLDLGRIEVVPRPVAL